MPAPYPSLSRSTTTFMRFKVKIIRQMTTARANTRRYRKQPTYVYRRKRKVQVGNKAGILTVQVTDSLSGGVAPRHAPRAVPRCTALAAARPLARRYPPLSARWHRCGAAPTMRESLSWQKRWSDRRFHHRCAQRQKTPAMGVATPTPQRQRQRRFQRKKGKYILCVSVCVCDLLYIFLYNGPL